MGNVQVVRLQAQFGAKHLGMVEVGAFEIGSTNPVLGHLNPFIVFLSLSVPERLSRAMM